MDFVLRPTLKHMCLQKIATQLCFHEDFLRPKNGKTLLEIPRESVANVAALPLSPLLQKELEYYIAPISWQADKWFNYLKKYYEIDPRKAKQPHWSSSGTIDAEKSVEALVADQSLAPKARYNLAEDYGYVERIRDLSQKIPPEGKEQSKKDYRWYKRMFGLRWRQYAQIESNKKYQEIIMREGGPLSPDQRQFCSALCSGRPGTVKDCYEKLKPEKDWIFTLIQREMNILWWFYYDIGCPNQNFPQIMCFLLSRMSEIQRMEILKANYTDLLLSFLVWPYQSLFFPNLERIRDFLSEDHFDELFIPIFDHINWPDEVCFVRDIFGEFWRSSPDGFKRKLVNGGVDTFFKLRYFFIRGEEDLCRMVLKEVSVSEAERMLLLGTKEHYRVNVKNDKDFLRFFLVESGLPREAIERVRQDVLLDFEAGGMKNKAMEELLLFLDNFQSELK